MRKFAAFAGIIALAAWLGACSSSSTSGTETFTGVLAGAAAANTFNSNSNVGLSFHSMTFSGPVNTTATSVSLGSSANGPHTFHTAAGNLTVTHEQKTNGNENPTITGKVGGTCHLKGSGGTGTYTVDGSQSTGSFAGATGSGNYSITYAAYATLHPGDSTCTANNIGNVVSTGAAITFKASGPLTIKS
jgi:hypothetical protein